MANNAQKQLRGLPTRRAQQIPTAWLVLFAIGTVATNPVHGQDSIRRSQHGTVSQRVGYTDITVVYNRPVARGRTLFGAGGVVRPGRIWNPGADSATTISFSRDVEIGDQELAAGRYTFWMIPDPERWTVIVSRAVDVFHTPYPGQALDALRFTVAPEHGDHMEVLAFYFPVVAPDSAVLRLHWGETIVPLTIRTR